MAKTFARVTLWTSGYVTVHNGNGLLEKRYCGPLDKVQTLIDAHFPPDCWLSGDMFTPELHIMADEPPEMVYRRAEVSMAMQEERERWTSGNCSAP
jgi:hypothetical protein